MTARDDILAQLGVIAQQAFAAQQNFLSASPDKATEDADLAAVQQALTTLIGLVDAYDFGGALRVSGYPNPFQFTAGQQVSYQFVAAGGSAPYRYLMNAGGLPAGLTCSSDGVLAGTVASASGSWDGVFVVEDAAGQQFQFAFWIKVA